VVPDRAFFAIFRTISGRFVNFLSEMLAFKLFLKRKRVSSCSQSEIGKISITEDKANAHAGMPFSGISRFVVPVSNWYGQQPFRGVGRLRLSVIGFP